MFNATLHTRTLFDAAENNDVETVQDFIEERGAPLTITNDLHQTLAQVAAKNGNLPLVKYILEKDPSLVKNDEEYLDTVFHQAVESNAFDVVKYMVERHDVNISKGECPIYRTTALHTAVKFNRLNILKYFLEERNGDVNLVDWQDIPLVFFAVKYEHPDILKYLVEEKNANMTMVDRYKENILYVTVQVNDLSAMKYLVDEIKVKLDINWRNYGGETLVHKTIIYNRMEMLEYLVGEKHADVNIPDDWHFLTSLHYAVSQNRYDMCKYLVEHGADTQFKDDKGLLPMHKATEERLSEYMKTVSKSDRRRRRSVVLPDYFAFKQPIQIPFQHCLVNLDKQRFQILDLVREHDDISSAVKFHWSSPILGLLTISTLMVKCMKFTKRHHQLQSKIFVDPKVLDDSNFELFNFRQ